VIIASNCEERERQTKSAAAAFRSKIRETTFKL